jgi:hypothetical protein
LNPSMLTPSGDECLAELAEAFRRTSRGDISGAQLIISSVTIVEGHVGRSLEAMISQSDIQESRLGVAILSEVRDGIFVSWSSMLGWMRKGFGIGISGDRPVQDFLTLVEARNALVHGNGRLTTRQAKTIEQLVKLRSRLRVLLDVELTATRLMLQSTTAERASRICREFVYHLDLNVVAEYPQLRLAMRW